MARLRQRESIRPLSVSSALQSSFSTNCNAGSTGKSEHRFTRGFTDCEPELAWHFRADPPQFVSPPGSPHLCSANCLRRLSCASVVFLRRLSGTLKVWEQDVHTPTAGTGPSHLTTRRLGFGTAEFPIRLRPIDWRLRIFLFHSGGDRPLRQARGNLVTRFHLSGALHQVSATVEDQGVSSLEDCNRRERLQLMLQPLQS